MPPIFSVILPTYNRARMLRSAIQSVLAQTCKNYECFILDDGSTDETQEVLSEFGQEPRLKIFRFKDNRRQHVRRNFALSLASGQFISFLDADDLWLPCRLEIFARHIEIRPNVDFWFSNAYVWRYGRIIGRIFDPGKPIQEGRLPGWHAVGDRLPYLTTNLAIRREVFDRIGHFREDMEILEDTELYARMLGQGISVGVVRPCLSIRRLHAEQITHDYERGYEEACLALRSGAIPDELLEIEKQALAHKTADYLWRSLQPVEARRFMLQELGGKARLSALFWMTWVPRPALNLARVLRRAYLVILYSPHWASEELREVYRFIEPILKKEAALGRRAK